ncbi:MAG: hypothetical protein OXI74_02390 [Rhodospirillaceae bacterium]|nr:hypothetical protein [Rhodospirillaceae bacterium]
MNYRTTEQTRRWASSVLERRSIDDLDGGDDDNKGVHSVTRGPEPLMRHFENRDGQATWLVGYLTDLMDHEVPLRGVCIVSRTQKERDAILEELSDAEVPVEVLEADAPDESSTGVRLATMHRVKGLEFDRVVIASANEDILPLPAAINATDADSSERIAAETAERALLYVSATRAKRELTVLSFGTPSSFLT